MKTQPQQLPHIYRFLSARIDLVVQKYALLPSDRKQLLINSLPLVVITLYLLFSLFSPASDFERAKLAVLNNPKDAQAHLALSQIFKKNYDFEKASQEALAASSLAPYDEEIKTEIGSLIALKTKPNQLQNELNFWQKISWQEPKFRDAFLQKAVFEYQLKNTPAAYADLQKTLELDPNFEPALEMEKILNSKF
ncbi:hypothetical protein HY030_03590 [Candidatus Gottesmanbacteria bacterium]|nr:hypothetical protein [Candidatus Gottesmanbacteria bacterium]